MTKPITITRRQLRIILAGLALAAEWENSAADCEGGGLNPGNNLLQAAAQHKRNEKVYLRVRDELNRKLADILRQ